VVVKKEELLHVDPRKILVEDNWNPRIDFGDMEEIKTSIKTGGVYRPIHVRRNAKKQLVLVDGARRLRAVLSLIEEGHKGFTSIPAIEDSPNTSEVEAMMHTLIANEGKPFTPLEEAVAFKRLSEMGMSEEELMAATGKSVTTIRTRLALIDAAPALKKGLEEGTVTVSLVNRIVRTSKDKDVQTQLLKKHKKEKKKKGASEAAASLSDDQASLTRTKLSGKRARELLFEVASKKSRFDRSRKPPTMMNSAYKELDKLLKRLAHLKRSGALRP